MTACIGFSSRKTRSLSGAKSLLTELLWQRCRHSAWPLAGDTRERRDRRWRAGAHLPPSYRRGAVVGSADDWIRDAGYRGGKSTRRTHAPQRRSNGGAVRLALLSGGLYGLLAPFAVRRRTPFVPPRALIGFFAVVVGYMTYRLLVLEHPRTRKRSTANGLRRVSLLLLAFGAPTSAHAFARRLGTSSAPGHPYSPDSCESREWLASGFQGESRERYPRRRDSPTWTYFRTLGRTSRRKAAVIVALHVATGAAAGAVSGSRTAALLCDRYFTSWATDCRMKTSARIASKLAVV